MPLPDDAAAVTVAADGREVGRRARSSHPPTASLVTPRAGARIRGAGSTLVRWRAADADGDALVTTVDYSPDGGRTWTVVAGDIRGTSVRVPNRLLSRAGDGRLRVRAGDGFDVAAATSGRLRVAGASPRVQILRAGRRTRVRADATILLRATAFDDAGRALTGAALRWYAGRRPIARGELATVRGLRPGRTVIRVVATDRAGRATQARLVVRVTAPRPRFLVARAPSRIAPRARQVRITVAASAPAVLRIAGRRHRVARAPRTIAVAVRPGRSTLRLPYALRSAGGVLRGTYVINR